MSLTRSRDLRTGFVPWTDRAGLLKAARPLRRSTRAEVVVVGAGISGALVAQSLCAAGLRPLLLDRRHGPLLGSTAASTALLLYELDQPLTRMIASVGKVRARAIWRASRVALGALIARAGELHIDADLALRPSLYLAGTMLDARGLAREARARQQLGLPSELLDRSSLRRWFGIDRPAALLSYGSAECDPVKLASGFLREALRRGAKLHTPTEVAAIERRRDHTALLTDEGIEIAAKHVIFCTGYELPLVVPNQGVKVRSTFVLQTGAQALPPWPQQALIWEASEPYLYARTLPDGRVLCGGEDADVSEARRRDALLPSKIRRIERKLQRLMPSIDTRAARAWTGSFGESEDSAPIIGEVPGYPRCHAVLGFGGNGITFSMLAAQLVTASVLGRRDPEARWFRFR